MLKYLIVTASSGPLIQYNYYKNNLQKTAAYIKLSALD